MFDKQAELQLTTTTLACTCAQGDIVAYSPFIEYHFYFPRALGVLAHKLSAHTQSANGTTPTTGVPSQPVSQDALSSLVAGLKRLLSSGVSLHRIVSVLVICHWQDCPHQDTLGPALLSALTDTTGLEDMLPYIVAMQRDCQVCRRRGVSVLFRRCGYEYVMCLHDPKLMSM